MAEAGHTAEQILRQALLIMQNNLVLTAITAQSQLAKLQTFCYSIVTHSKRLKHGMISILSYSKETLFSEVHLLLIMKMLLNSVPFCVSSGLHLVLSTWQLPQQLCNNRPMKNSNIYAAYRYPAQIISHAG